MNHEEKSQSQVGHFHGGGFRRIAGRVLLGIVVAVFFALVFGLAVKALWNWIMPPVFGLAVISYWQAFGIIILSKILFSGMHPHPDRHARSFRRRRPSYERWWREEGQAAFDDWARRKGGADAPQVHDEK